ncbi:MAG: dihydroorotase [Bacteroidales bacterium]|nr:dihydroorotase [Bacteroidales bacterium]
MSQKTLFVNATIVNDGRVFHGELLIEGAYITEVSDNEIPRKPEYRIIDLENRLLMPGVIDDQVHFREPGMTYKGSIATESRAAVAGGVTSFMDMPNNNPPILTTELLESKYQIGAENSLANYSFYMGASNDNIEEVLKVNPKMVCGVKVFMGSSTGNMLVDNKETLSRLFNEVKMLIATHCEDEATIKANLEAAKQQFGENIPITEHPKIRSEEACYLSSSLAVELAKKHNSRLHVLHLTTAREMELFDNHLPLSEKRITAEVCVHHLTFSDVDYEKFGTRIKWNPAIKKETDRLALIEALENDQIDVVATDHAPHTIEEKTNSYLKAPSGGPLVQHSLQAMLEFYHDGTLNLETIVRKMCHAPADCFRVEKRGYLKPGYFADIVIVDLKKEQKVAKENLLYHCEWSPFEGKTFRSSIVQTYVNGNKVFDNGALNEDYRGMRLTFNY